MKHTGDITALIDPNALTLAFSGATCADLGFEHKSSQQLNAFDKFHNDLALGRMKNILFGLVYQAPRDENNVPILDDIVMKQIKEHVLEARMRVLDNYNHSVGYSVPPEEYAPPPVHNIIKLMWADTCAMLKDAIDRPEEYRDIIRTSELTVKMFVTPITPER